FFRCHAPKPWLAVAFGPTPEWDGRDLDRRTAPNAGARVKPPQQGASAEQNQGRRSRHGPRVERAAEARQKEQRAAAESAREHAIAPGRSAPEATNERTRRPGGDPEREQDRCRAERDREPWLFFEAASQSRPHPDPDDRKREKSGERHAAAGENPLPARTRRGVGVRARGRLDHLQPANHAQHPARPSDRRQLARGRDRKGAMRSCLLALACVTFPALARASGGEAMSSPAPAYSAWQGARHPGPPPAWFDRAPAPLPEQPEVPRRAFELVTEGAGAVPECRSSVALGCAGLAGGMELGLQALYRPTPSFAIGGTFRLDALSLQRAGAS